MGYDRQNFGLTGTTTDLAVLCCTKLKEAAENIDELVFIEDVESSGAVIGGKFSLLGIYTLTVQYGSASTVKVTVEKGTVQIGEYSLSASTGTTKSIGYILAANPYAAALYLMDYQGYNKAAFILTADGVSWYYGTSSGSNITIPGTTLWVDEETMQGTYSAANRLPYTVEGTDVDIIDSLAMLTNGQKAIELRGLYDCSNVTAKSRFNLDGEAFFAVTGNIAMKL